MSDEIKSPIMDKPAACEYLGGISIHTLNKWTWLGIIPYVKIGARTMYRQSDLDSLIESQVHKAGKRIKEGTDPFMQSKLQGRDKKPTVKLLGWLSGKA